MSATTLQIVTDAHAAGKPEGHEAGRKLTEQSAAVLADTLAAGSLRGDVQAVLDLGDLIEHSGNVAPPTERPELDTNNFARCLGLFDHLKVPHLHCIGNHPLMNLSEQVLLDQLGLKQPYFARDIGEHRVIMLHSRFSYKHDDGIHKSGSGIFIDEEQRRWLKDELNRSDRPVLVCSHHPLSDQDLSGNVWFQDYPQCALMSPEDRSEIQEILAKSGKVVAVLNGHTHWNYLAVDDFGIPHVTLQSLGENFRNDGTPASTYGIAVLKDAAFNLEIFGNDLALRNATQDLGQIGHDLAATYDSIARRYADGTSQFGAPEQNQFLKIEQMLLPRHGNVVVDFGCGPGRDVPYYAGRGFDVVGVDVSRELLKIARERSPEQTFVEDNFANARLTPNSAAIVIHSSTLQHVPHSSLHDVLRKAFETLEPGGIFYAHYRSGKGESLAISTEYGVPIARFIALYEAAEMEAALRSIGFEIIESDTFDHKYEGLKGQTVKYKTRTFARKPLND